MTWKEFYRQIRQGEVHSAYLFSGVEEYVKREALETLAQRLLPAGMEALNRVDLEGATARQIIDAAETLPFACQRRLVVVRDWDPLAAGKARGEAEDAAAMLAWLERAPESCTVVFYMRGEADGRKKLTMALKKRGAQVQFDLLDEAEVFAWVNKRLKPLGKTMTREAAAQMCFAAGRELTRLCGEVDKLAACVGERETIDLKDVERMVSPSLEYSVFEMLDALFSGEEGRAQDRLRALLAGGESCVGILAMIIRQVRMTAHLALAAQPGGDARAVEQALKLHPYAARRAREQARGLDAQALCSLFETCVGLDFDVKSGRVRDREALQMAMLKIAALRSARPGTRAGR